MNSAPERPVWTSYEEWEQTVPAEITQDAIWSLKVYRLALFASDIGWYDVTKLAKDPRTRDLSGQLYRSLGSESANIEEGYSKSSARDRARFYEYSLGSTRESRGWYYRGRFVLSRAVVHHRISLQTEIIKLLLTMIPQQRNSSVLREPDPIYHVRSDVSFSDLSDLLTNIPFA